MVRGLVAALVVIAALFWPWPADARQQPGTRPAGSGGQEINRVEFRTVDNRTITLEALGARVVLLDFWATWCAPCLAELPRLKKLHAEYDRADFAIIGISLDTLDRRTFTSWVRRNGIEWPQVLEGRGYNGDLARWFRIEKLPVTILLNREGEILARDLRGPTLEAAIRRNIPR